MTVGGVKSAEKKLQKPKKIKTGWGRSGAHSSKTLRDPEGYKCTYECGKEKEERKNHQKICGGVWGKHACSPETKGKVRNSCRGKGNNCETEGNWGERRPDSERALTGLPER